KCTKNSFYRILNFFISEFAIPEGPEEESETLRAVGKHLCERARQTPTDFWTLVRQKMIASQELAIESARRCLHFNHETPAFWAAAVMNYMKHLEEAPRYPDFEVPVDVSEGRTVEDARTQAQRLVHRFGELLIHWPALVAAAQRLKD